MIINIWVLVAIIVLSIMPAGVQAQSDYGLVAEWHFDEGEGNIVKDSSGNGNDGVIYGATWVDGKYGYALQFDGVDDKVKLPYSVIDGLTDVTSEFLVKTSDTNGGIITGANSRENNEFLIMIKPNINGAKIYIKGSYHEFHGNAAINDGKWHHVAIIRDVPEVSIYVDGKFEGVWTNTPIGTFTINQNGLWLGGDQDSVGGGWETHQQFSGIIDEIRIYNYALSAEEIKEHYEQGPTALSLRKTASPQSIKQDQTTTITITVKNTGSTEIKDIEIADTLPQDLTFIDGETSKSYATLAPKDSRQFQYLIQLNEAGTYNLDPATATYADEKGNYHTVKSKPAIIEVIPSLITNSDHTPSKKSDGNVQTASVNLHGEKTDVALGEDVLLKLSAVNIIGNPTMHVQVIIIPPSGWSVTSSEFAKSGAGQYTTTYELESGGGKDIEVRIVPNQIGDDFQVEGRIIYYFGDDLETREDHTLSLPIKVKAEPDDGEKSSADSEESKTPGFGVLVAVIGLLMTSYLIKRK